VASASLILLVAFLLPGMVWRPSIALAYGVVASQIVMALRFVLHSKIGRRLITFVIFTDVIASYAVLATFNRWKGYVNDWWHSTARTLLYHYFGAKASLVPAAEILRVDPDFAARVELASRVAANVVRGS
jgi:hypothetical protein